MYGSVQLVDKKLFKYSSLHKSGNKTHPDEPKLARAGCKICKYWARKYEKEVMMHMVEEA
jgi:hypothetical protein